MKKIVVLFVLVISLVVCGITSFAEIVELKPVAPAVKSLKKFPTADWYETGYLVNPFGTQFYINVGDRNYKDFVFESNGIISAKLVDYDPETMVDYMGDDEENKFVTYKVYDSITETDVATGLSYFVAKDMAKASENYSVVAETYVNIIEVNVAENYSETYKKGIVKIFATLDGKELTGKMEIISDVFVKDFSEEERLSVSAETLESIPEIHKDIKGAYVGQEYEMVIDNIIGAKTYSRSGDIPDGLEPSGSWAYKNAYGDYVFKMALTGTPTKAGTYNFSITYKKEDGKTVVSKVDYTVTVGAKAPFESVQSIYVEKWPDKTEYYLGDSVDLTGMKVTAVATIYDEKTEEYIAKEIDVTDLAWVEPAVFTSDEAQSVMVYVKAPSASSKLQTFEDSFRVTFKYDNVEPEETPETDKYIELNVGKDPGYSSYYGGVSSLETPAHVISTDGFMLAKGGKAVINGDYFTITIPKVNSAQRGVNFLYDYSLNLEGDYPCEGYPSIKFYSDAIIQSDYVFEWNLGFNYFELRELFGLKVEEDDVIEYYVIDGDEKCVGKFTVDYMTADVSKEVKLKFNIPDGSKLPDYRISTSAPAGDYYIPNVDGYFGVSEMESVLKISSEVIPAGKNGKVFVELSENSKASAIQFTLDYDSEVLKLVSCEAGEIVKDATINSSVEGKISFAWENVNGLEKGESLLELEFEAVKANESQKTLIKVDDNKKFIFARGDFSDIPVKVINGEINVINVLYGDINGDISVDVKDAFYARLIAAKLINFTEQQKLSGDVDGDGRITAIDANYIRRFAVELISEFPVEEDDNIPENGEIDEPEENEKTEFAMAMITDSGDITDQSYNQVAYEACKEVCEAEDFSFSYFKPETDSDDDRLKEIEKALDGGYDVIIMQGYTFGYIIRQIGVEEYPEVKFVALDVSEYDITNDFSWTIPENVYSSVYHEEISGYMAGYAAVKLGYTKLGFLGGMAVPAVLRYGYGFLQGADAAAVETGADVSVNWGYANQFYGDRYVTAAMDDWYSAGTEVVFACGGSVYTSVAEAAAKVGGKVIGMDVDQATIIDTVYGEKMTLTSAMKGLAPTVKTVLSQIISGEFVGGRVENLGIVSENPAENFVQLSASTQWSDTFTEADYNALVAAIYNGEIVVDSSIDGVAADYVTVITVNDIGIVR